ncbi:LOW QUALITY PROTEIN: polycystin-1-like protein 3 [Megaptera novaeangliae]
MFFKGRTWLWLYITTGIILGSELDSPEHHGEHNCYQLSRFHCSFQEAEDYCHAQGGHPAFTWNQEVQDLLRDFLEEGKKWWVGEDLTLLGKHQEKNNPDSFTFMSKIDAFSDQDASYERNGNNSHSYWKPKRTKEVAIPRNKMTSALNNPQSKTPRHSISPFPSIPPGGTQQGVSVTPVPTSQPLPVPLELTRPGSVTHAGKAPGEITSSPKKDAHPGVFTTHPQASFQSISDQVSVIDALIDLNEQLLQSPFPNSSNLGSRMPVTVCLFHSLNNITKTSEASRQRPKDDTEQVENTLNMSLLSLRRIQEAFLQQNWFESAVTLTSFAATLLLSRQNISTLPLSSYTFGSPAPVRLGFPSASVLEQLLNKHPGVNIQVRLAFNPFRDFDDKKFVGSIGSVLLSSNHKLLQVHDLMEDINIVLWRNASMGTHPTSLNVSADYFTITVNVTSLEKSLIVCVEPESPVSVMLYLGFQHQPNHTHFHLNLSLPKEEVSQKDEPYTRVLTPESLQDGVGTYYITALLHRGKEGAQQTPALLSVVTAVTQRYFWDSGNSTWRSRDARSEAAHSCLSSHLSWHIRAQSAHENSSNGRKWNGQPELNLVLWKEVSHPDSILDFSSTKAGVELVRVTVLADNDPSSQFHYLIKVSTGCRRRAATTTNVVITLYGSERQSEPHRLCDSQKAVFERGGLDVFLLGTPSSLRELHSLQLWHDRSGISPYWSTCMYIVTDMVGKRKWHFLCNCWLAMDLGDCERDSTFILVSKKELFSCRHLFSSMIVENFTQDCLWLSVTAHPWTQFTRVQRLTCCMTLLLCNMVTYVMFKMNGTTTKRREQAVVGPFAVTWSELLVSIQTAVTLFPVSLGIGRLFPLIQPQEPLPLFPPIQASCLSDASFEPLSLTEIVEFFSNSCPPSRHCASGFFLFIVEWCEHWYECRMYYSGGIKGNCGIPAQEKYIPTLSVNSLHGVLSYNINQLVKLLSRLLCSYLEGQGHHQRAGPYWANVSTWNVLSVVPENHRHFHSYLIRVLRRLQSHLGTLGPAQAHQPCDFLDAVSQLQKLQERLETRILPTEQGPSRDATRALPILSPEGKQPISNARLRWLTYFCWLLLGVTSLASAFFTALYSLELNKDQATSWVISILSLLQNIFIPVKVIFLTLFYSLLLNRMLWLHKEKEHHTKRILALLARCPSSLPGSRDENNPIYVAPAMNGPVKRPERTLKEKKCFKLTGDILVQILFLILLMTAVYSAHNSNRFYLRQAIHQSFPYRFSEIKLLNHFYSWASSTLLPNLYRDYRVSLFQFNLLFGWSISDYRTFLSSAVTAVGLLMGISHHKEVIALNPVLGSFLILLTSVVLMVLEIINLFVSAILMAFGKERKSFKTQTEAALADMLLLKLSSLSGKQSTRTHVSKRTAVTAMATDK